MGMTEFVAAAQAAALAELDAVARRRRAENVIRRAVLETAVPYVVADDGPPLRATPHRHRFCERHDGPSVLRAEDAVCCEHADPDEDGVRTTAATAGRGRVAMSARRRPLNTLVSAVRRARRTITGNPRPPASVESRARRAIRPRTGGR